jgi:hypothetical protein
MKEIVRANGIIMKIPQGISHNSNTPIERPAIEVLSNSSERHFKIPNRVATMAIDARTPPSMECPNTLEA